MLSEHHHLVEQTEVFGRYQLFQAIVLELGVVCCAGHTLSFIFTSVTPEIQCPSYGWNETTWTEVSKETSNDTSSCGLLMAKRKTCPNWTYDRSIMDETVVTKYDAVCSKEHLVSLSVTLYMCGWLVGAFMYGYISDRFGRLKGIYAGAIHTVIAGFISTFVDNFIVYTVSRFFLGMGALGLMLIIYTTLPECASNRNRGYVMMIINTSWSNTILFLCLLAYFTRSATTMNLILSCMTIIPLVASLLLQESPRWLLSKGHIDRLKTTVKSITRFNGTKFHLNKTVVKEEKKLNSDVNESSDKTESVNIQSFLRRRGTRRVTLVIWYNNLMISLAYYGLSMSFSGLGGWNFYINISISAALELIGILLVMSVGQRINRIPTMIGLYGALALLLLIGVGLSTNSKFSLPLSIVSFIARALSSICFSYTCYYTIEVYPTTHRTFGLGMSAAISRVSAMVAPFVHYMVRIWIPLPYLVYGILAAINTVLYVFMPETRYESTDTIDEAEDMIKRCTLRSSCSSDPHDRDIEMRQA